MSNKQIEAISLEQAAKLALEALEYVDAPLNDETVDLWEQKTDAAITALREALMSVPDGAAQPRGEATLAQQEPVASFNNDLLDEVARLNKAVADERSACAKVCEIKWNKHCEEPYGYALAVNDCAAAIRARGNT